VGGTSTADRPPPHVQFTRLQVNAVEAVLSADGLTGSNADTTIPWMADDSPEILILDSPVAPAILSRLVERFEDMVKYVVDVEQGRIAIGGEMHADAEQVLLETGSLQENLWGANYYPGRGPSDCIEFTALINIRPAANNRGMELQDPTLRERIRALTSVLVGQGEAL
jgi:hypothetical protein